MTDETNTASVTPTVALDPVLFHIAEAYRILMDSDRSDMSAAIHLRRAFESLRNSGEATYDAMISYGSYR